jgi:hypothetical protein
MTNFHLHNEHTVNRLKKTAQASMLRFPFETATYICRNVYIHVNKYMYIDINTYYYMFISISICIYTAYAAIAMYVYTENGSLFSLVGK